MGWTAVAQLMRTYECPSDASKVLVLTVSLDPLLVVAFETTRPLDGGAISDHAEHVFAQHGHKVVGDFDLLPVALSAAENFAKQWRLGRSIDRCDCEEIGSAPRTPASGEPWSGLSVSKGRLSEG